VAARQGGTAAGLTGTSYAPRVRSVLAIVLVGCAPHVAPSPVAAPPPRPAVPVVEPAPVRPAKASPRVRADDESLPPWLPPYPNPNPAPPPVAVAETDFLSPCARQIVLAQAPAARRALVAVLTQYATTCEGASRITLDRPLGGGAARRSRSDAALIGELASNHLALALRVASCTPGDGAVDQITIVADGDAWRSPRLEFHRDAAGCDVAELPYTRELGKVLAQAAAANDARIQLRGGELVLGDTIQHELQLVLAARDALEH
jgi:hypothetical protein